MNDSKENTTQYATNEFRMDKTRKTYRNRGDVALLSSEIRILVGTPNPHLDVRGLPLRPEDPRAVARLDAGSRSCRVVRATGAWNIQNSQNYNQPTQIDKGNKNHP